LSRPHAWLLPGAADQARRQEIRPRDAAAASRWLFFSSALSD